MNIFILDYVLANSAQYHVDRHIVKMPLETAQMLSTAVKEVVSQKVLTDCFNHAERLYKTSHLNHPCSVWARQTKQNFLWLCDFGEELCKEYSFRYEKTHKSQEVIRSARFFADWFPKGERTEFVQAMPEEYKSIDPVVAYRDYYVGEKKHLFKWKKRDAPKWVRKHWRLSYE